jgi:hypothetical protein
MTRQDHLLTIIAEECVETAQRATKALRFGIDEVQPGQDLTNSERLMQEAIDLAAALEMLAEQSPVFRKIYEDSERTKKWRYEKIDKVNHFLEYSRQQGRLEE